MVPLGLVLIAQDIPFLRKPVARLIAWGIDRWERWQRSRAARRAAASLFRRRLAALAQHLLAHAEAVLAQVGLVDVH